jgi:hypothetical protein
MIMVLAPDRRAQVKKASDAESTGNGQAPEPVAAAPGSQPPAPPAQEGGAPPAG